MSGWYVQYSSNMQEDLRFAKQMPFVPEPELRRSDVGGSAALQLRPEVAAEGELLNGSSLQPLR